MKRDELKEMIIEYMGKGFLENIIDMFRYDPSLFEFIPSMIKSENLRVRVGTLALIEELKGDFQEEMRKIIPGIVEILKDNNPENRGDAAYILELINNREALQHLRELCNDPHQEVRDIALEILKKADINC